MVHCGVRSRLAKTTVDKSMKEKLHLIRSEFLSFPDVFCGCIFAVRQDVISYLARLIISTLSCSLRQS